MRLDQLKLPIKLGDDPIMNILVNLLFFTFIFQMFQLFIFGEGQEQTKELAEKLNLIDDDKTSNSSVSQTKSKKSDPEADAYKCFNDCVNAKDFCIDTPKYCYEVYDSCNNTCCFKYEKYDTSATILCKNR